MKLRPFHLLVPLLVACGGDPQPKPETAKEPVVAGPDLGKHTRAVTTASPEAQRAFDRGLVLLYAFNHDAAIVAFQEATKADPGCAMAWWGMAHANGPHINNPAVPPDRARAGREAADKAMALREKVTPVERALIEAQSARFAPDPAAERRPFDEAYAANMEVAWKQSPKDADVAVLYAESLMDLQPWDLWTPAGETKGRTQEILAALERALELQPENPGANHLYVHAIEASPTPEKGVPAADRLRALVPDAGHLVHMPSHIDIRVGEWGKAIEANQRAIEADARAEARTPRTGFYRVYMLHNRHFLAFSAMLAGRSKLAEEAARGMLAKVPPELIASAGPVVDGFLPVVYHVLVRFGRWEQVLDEPGFAPELIVANAVRHYARGVALNALGKAAQADEELAQLEALVKRLDDRAIGNNPAKKVMEIPVLMLTAEISFKKGDTALAIGMLRQAVDLEEALVYDEPPDWMMTPRHPLAAMLIATGRHEQAQKVLEGDLRRFPENGWALRGLLESARARRDEPAAAKLAARFEKAWAGADVEIDSPCLCVPGKKR